MKAEFDHYIYIFDLLYGADANSNRQDIQNVVCRCSKKSLFLRYTDNNLDITLHNNFHMCFIDKLPFTYPLLSSFRAGLMNNNRMQKSALTIDSALL